MITLRKYHSKVTLEVLFQNLFTENYFGGNTNSSANNSATQIRVKGWKTSWSDANYTVQYNEDIVQVTIHIASDNIPPSESYYGAQVLKDGSVDLRPRMRMIMTEVGNRYVIIVADNNYAVGRSSLTGSTLSNMGVYANFTYKRR